MSLYTYGTSHRSIAADWADYMAVNQYVRDAYYARTTCACGDPATVGVRETTPRCQPCRDTRNRAMAADYAARQRARKDT